MKITELKTEYRDNPIGLDNPHPRFSWILESEDRDVRQQAYRIVVKTDEETLWDTGRVEKDSSVLIPYEGKPFSPCSAYLVQIIRAIRTGARRALKPGCCRERHFRRTGLPMVSRRRKRPVRYFLRISCSRKKRGRKLPLSGFMPPHWGCMKSG